MNRWLVAILLIAGFASLTIAPCALADGASASAVVRISWTILPFQSLTIAGQGENRTSVSDHYVLHQPQEADFARGAVEERKALVLNATSNIPWTVKVYAVESDMGTSHDGSSRKPLSDFSLRVNGGSYFTISNFPQTIASGDRGHYLLSIDYKVKVDKDTYKPGDYGLTLVYTITGR